VQALELVDIIAKAAAATATAKGEADVAAQVETLPQEMLAILGDVNQEEIFLMEDQEMDIRTYALTNQKNVFSLEI
jgi:hypothetical protein